MSIISEATEILRLYGHEVLANKLESLEKGRLGMSKKIIPLIVEWIMYVTQMLYKNAHIYSFEEREKLASITHKIRKAAEDE